MSKFKSRAVCKILQVAFALPKLGVNKLLSGHGSAKDSPKSILIFCIAHIGDVLCLLPSLHFLRKIYPKAEITVLSPPSLCEFLRKTPLGLIPVPYDEKDVWSNLRLFMRVRLYDTAYVFWAKRELILAQAIGCKNVITYDKFKKRYYAYLGNRFIKAPDTINVEKRFTNLIKAANEKVSSNMPSLRFNLSEYFQDTPAIKDPVVLLHSCCKSHCKIVPPSYWRKIASEVSSLGYKPVFTGNGDDEAEFIRKIDPDNRYEHAGNRYSLWELAKLMNHSKLLVTVDTGIMHLAKYTGIEILALCGGSNPERIGPSEFFRDEGEADETGVINKYTNNTNWGGDLL